MLLKIRITKYKLYNFASAILLFNFKYFFIFWNYRTRQEELKRMRKLDEDDRSPINTSKATEIN